MGAAKADKSIIMAKPASSLVNAILDPVLAKRAGLSIALVESWPEIVGARVAELSCPIRINWPRRAHQDDPFEPGVLVIAAEGAGALHVQHQTGEILSRVNAFMGFAAVARIRIVQKQIAQPAPPPKPRRPLTEAETAKVDRLADGFEDDRLRESVRRFGRSVLSEKR